MATPSALSELQIAQIQAATNVFKDVFPNKSADAKIFHDHLMERMQGHPQWSIKDTACSVFETMYPPKKATKAFYEKGVEFEDRIRHAHLFESDPAVAKLLRPIQEAQQKQLATNAKQHVEAWEKMETAMHDDKLISMPIALKTYEIKTSFDDNPVEARALAHAIHTLTQTTGFSAAGTAIWHGENPFTTQGRNQGRYEAAQAEVSKQFEQAHVRYTGQDVEAIMQAALPIARDKIKERTPQK